MVSVLEKYKTLHCWTEKYSESGFSMTIYSDISFTDLGYYVVDYEVNFAVLQFVFILKDKIVMVQVLKCILNNQLRQLQISL